MLFRIAVVDVLVESNESMTSGAPTTGLGQTVIIIGLKSVGK
jgi:hypothetical protein